MWWEHFNRVQVITVQCISAGRVSLLAKVEALVAKVLPEMSESIDLGFKMI